MQRGIISVAARAFVRKVGDSLASSSGGNPVTVFIIPSKSSTARLREDLVKSCAWESVCVVPREADAPKLFFYMPTGEEQVIFCAHATCGAASVINMKNLNDTKISYKIDFVPAMSGIEGDCIKQTAKIRNENVVEITLRRYDNTWISAETNLRLGAQPLIQLVVVPVPTAPVPGS